MQTELLEILCCPRCHDDLQLEILEGTRAQVAVGRLLCTGCKMDYDVRDDVPFFCPQVKHSGVRNQVTTYSTWWDRYHADDSIVDPSHQPAFHESLRIHRDEFRHRVVLDAGCGNGRFSYVTSHYQPKLLVSFDISSGVIHAKKTIQVKNRSSNVAFVQGDITAPPFKLGSFDIVFSWGVLHHTPNARQAFSGIASLVRLGGRLAVYVYEFHPLYKYHRQALSLLAYLRSLLLIRPLRGVCSRLSPRVVHLFFVPIYYIERATGIGVVGCHGPSSDRWNKKRYFRVVIDRFKTRYASEHQLEEVIEWFAENGCNRLLVGGNPRLSIAATRESASPLDSVDVNITGPRTTRTDRRSRPEPTVLT